jgi:TonB-linked SusC/RagA family outer membrane protein
MKNMKFTDIIFQKLLVVVVVFLCLQFSGTVYGQEKGDELVKKDTIGVHLIVVDNNGNPIPNVQIVIGEGVFHAETDANGASNFTASSSEIVTISMSGYESTIVGVDQILKNNTVQLTESKLFLSGSDDVALPFMTMKKRRLTGSEGVIAGCQLSKYPSIDLRLAFSGLADGLEVGEKYGITGMSAEEKIGKYSAKEKVGMYLRGQSPIWIIDDVPTDITEMQLDPEEIESVTLLKDVVAKTMFGPQAANGAIFIKTKRGIKNDRVLNVNFEYGVNTIDRMPEFVSGADYARLNNLAKTNSGLTPNYTEADIAAYEKNDPYDMRHPSINFRDYMLKNTKAFKRANVSSRGGNENVQYFANLNYAGEGDIYKIGPAAGFNRITTRENVDIKVNDLVKVKFDFYGGLSFLKSNNYGSTKDDTNADINSVVVQFDKVLDDITTISPIAFPVYANNSPELERPWYGIASNFNQNPIGRIKEQGYYTETTRNGNIAFTLDYDLKNVIKGLTSKTFIDYQTLHSVRLGKQVDYNAYFVAPTNINGVDTFSLTYSRAGSQASDESKLHDYYYNRLAVYETLNFERTFGVHAVQTSATFYMAKWVYNEVEEPRRLLSGIWSGSYSYNDKYMLQAAVNYSGTSSFTPDKRNIVSPAVGIGWVVSEEGFMANIKAINYLKLRANAGKLAYESFRDPFLYNTVYSNNTNGMNFGPAPTTYWFGSGQDQAHLQTEITRIGNPDLTWETRKEISFGMDALLLNRTLSLEATYYNNTRQGEITQLNNTIPYLTGLSNAKPYYNYNNTRFYGVELGLQYTNKIGSFKYSIGGNANIQDSKVLKVDEPAYRYAYQSKVGNPADAYYGLKYIGQFSSDGEALVVPQLYDSRLHAGDLKYADMNSDGVVDDNDKGMVGHTAPRLVYSLNINLNYKGIELTVIGIGKSNYDIPLTNYYYWNGWQNNNYSKFVLEHNGGSYPTLTYNKVSNNYQNSSFWLASGNFFKIKNVELAYTFPTKLSRKLYTRGIRVYVHAANLFTVSKLKDVDPENINAGLESYPLYRTFTGGIKLTF